MVDFPIKHGDFPLLWQLVITRGYEDHLHQSNSGNDPIRLAVRSLVSSPPRWSLGYEGTLCPNGKAAWQRGGAHPTGKHSRAKREGRGKWTGAKSLQKHFWDDQIWLDTGLCRNLDKIHEVAVFGYPPQFERLDIYGKMPSVQFFRSFRMKIQNEMSFIDKMCLLHPMGISSVDHRSHWSTSDGHWTVLPPFPPPFKPKPKRSSM